MISPRSRPGRRLALAVAAVTLFGGIALACGSTSPRTLPERVRSFNRAVRWSRADLVGGMVLPLKRSELLAEFDTMARERTVMDVETVRVTTLDDNTADVIIKVQSTSKASTIIESHSYKVTWSKVSGDWFVAGFARAKPARPGA